MSFFSPIWLALLASFLLYLTNSLTLARFSARVVTPVGKLPPPRAEHSSVVINTQDGYFLIIHGGKNENGALNDTWTYIVNRNSWEILSPLDARLKNDPPPPMYGATSGYRYVEGFSEPFFYVTLGTNDGKTKFYNEMWALELGNFTWKKVQLDGDIPSARYSATSGFDVSVNYEGRTKAELIVTHGFGEAGVLSDAYRCQFDEFEPYKATWKKIHGPISQYSLFRPHPVYNHGSTLTAKRDIVMFGGCYSSENFGGHCPSNAAWQLQKDHDGRDFTTSDGDDGYRYTWARLSSEPSSRIGCAMSQALSSFEGVYESSSEIAVLYSGLNEENFVNSSQLFSYERITNAEIAMYSTKSMKWIRERVELIGDKSKVLESGRFGASLDVAFDTRITKEDVPNEFYLLFGGQFDDGTFTDTIVQVSFDPYALPDKISGSAKYWTRPQVHGVLMFTAFGILTPAAAFVLRYLREKRKRSILHTSHMSIKILVLAISWIGYAVVRNGGTAKSSQFDHGIIGYAILILASIQPLFAIISGGLRIGKRKKSTSSSESYVRTFWYFSLWKWLYRMTGLSIIILGLFNITLGVFLLTSPLLLWVHWIVYIIVISIIGFWMELTLVSLPVKEYEFTDPNSFGVRSSPPTSNYTPERISIPAPVHTRHRSSRFRTVRQIFSSSNNRNKTSETSQALSGSSVPYFK